MVVLESEEAALSGSPTLPNQFRFYILEGRPSSPPCCHEPHLGDSVLRLRGHVGKAEPLRG